MIYTTTSTRSLIACSDSPGVSVKIICPRSSSNTACIEKRVVFGFGLVMATFVPIIELINVDLPAFVLPMMATYPDFIFLLVIPESDRGSILYRFPRRLAGGMTVVYHWNVEFVVNSCNHGHCEGAIATKAISLYTSSPLPHSAGSR